MWVYINLATVIFHFFKKCLIVRVLFDEAFRLDKYATVFPLFLTAASLLLLHLFIAHISQRP